MHYLDRRYSREESCWKTLPVDRFVAFRNFGDVTKLK